MAVDFNQQAIWDWLLTCPHIRDLYFTFGEVQDGSTVLRPITAYKDRTLKKFVDGSSICQCDFALIRYEAMSNTPNSTQNIATQERVEQLATWIDDQDIARNFPEFPAGRRVQKVQTLPTETGFVAAIGEQMAKFLLHFRIEYYCEE